MCPHGPGVAVGSGVIVGVGVGVAVAVGVAVGVGGVGEVAGQDRGVGDQLEGVAHAVRLTSRRLHLCTTWGQKRTV